MAHCRREPRIHVHSRTARPPERAAGNAGRGRAASGPPTGCRRRRPWRCGCPCSEQRRGPGRRAASKAGRRAGEPRLESKRQQQADLGKPERSQTEFATQQARQPLQPLATAALAAPRRPNQRKARWQHNKGSYWGGGRLEAARNVPSGRGERWRPRRRRRGWCGARSSCTRCRPAAPGRGREFVVCVWVCVWVVVGVRWRVWGGVGVGGGSFVACRRHFQQGGWMRAQPHSHPAACSSRQQKPAPTPCPASSSQQQPAASRRCPQQPAAPPHLALLAALGNHHSALSGRHVHGLGEVGQAAVLVAALVGPAVWVGQAATQVGSCSVWPCRQRPAQIRRAATVAALAAAIVGPAGRQDHGYREGSDGGAGGAAAWQQRRRTQGVSRRTPPHVAHRCRCCCCCCSYRCCCACACYVCMPKCSAQTSAAALELVATLPRLSVLHASLSQFLLLLLLLLLLPPLPLPLLRMSQHPLSQRIFAFRLQHP